MYAILKQDNTIGGFEDRDVPLSELVHESFKHLYIEIPVDHNLKIGDFWRESTKTWETVELPVFVEPPKDPYFPTNIEIAQMISDLQADLLIAGVI